jgi:putative tryptophan/tyrosine transport system substrate-binding protein
MKRRALLCAGMALVARPVAVPAQVQRPFRIGYLATSDQPTTRAPMDAFLTGLRDKGYQLGNNLMLDVRYAAGDIQRLPALASELVAAKPDVLVGLEPAAVALRRHTSTIPIVLLASGDPVAAGLANSLARPGMNVTGLSNQFHQTVAKHIELLLEIAPRISRLALLNYGPSTAESAARFQRAAEIAAEAKGVTVISAIARNADTLGQAFATFEAAKAEGLVVVPTAPALQERQAIIDHALRLRLPSVSALPPAWIEGGGMLNYGANTLDDYRYVASIVDRILKGANPADMPIEQPSRFELAVNLRAAQRIGIKIPQAIILRASRVIE